MLPTAFCGVNTSLKMIKPFVFLSYLSINTCNSFTLTRWNLGGSFTFKNDSLDLQRSTPEMPCGVCYVRNGPGSIGIPFLFLCSGWHVVQLFLSAFCDWLVKGDLPPQALLKWCYKVKVRHSLGCSLDSMSLLLSGLRQSAAAGCLPVSHEHTKISMWH